MSTKKQVLILEPSYEIHFKGPDNEIIESPLILTNPTDRYVCFIVKTTAPKSYCVKPNRGIINPKKDVTIQILRQPFSNNPDKNKPDKFKIQTMFLPEENANTDDLQCIFDQAKPESIMNSFIKCVFDESDKKEIKLTLDEEIEEITSAISDGLSQILKKILTDDDDDDDDESKKNKAVGLRVVRGPDWKWDNQDGGEGSVGTVVEIGKGDSFPPTVVSVQWDNGIQKKYRAGLSGAYDLRTLDNAPYGVRFKGVNCDSCQKEGIFGIRWKCKDCYDFDLCSLCYMAGRHDITHTFTRFLTPGSTGVDVPKRQGSVRIQMKGIFPSAKVVRGPDWRWEDQDGGVGNVGRVLALRPWNDDTDRNAVRIEWSAANKTDIYRLGHAGKVDVKYVQAAADGFYYRDHLPILGDETRAVRVVERSNSILPEEPRSRQSSVSENRPADVSLEDRVIKDSTLTKGGLMHLSGNFKDFFLKKKFCDMKIKVREQTFEVHKAIFAARSPYYATKIHENDSTLEVKDCNPSEFKDYLYYVYTGEIVSNSVETVLALSDIADKHADKVLKIECNRVLKKLFAIDNFSDFIAAA